MAVKMYLVPKVTRRRVFSLSDMPVEPSAKTFLMKDEDFIAYQHAKTEFERWQDRLSHVSRYGYWSDWT